jgi:hypothetical protein
VKERDGGWDAERNREVWKEGVRNR